MPSIMSLFGVRDGIIHSDVCVVGEGRGEHCSSVERESGILVAGLNPNHTVGVVFCF